MIPRRHTKLLLLYPTLMSLTGCQRHRDNPVYCYHRVLGNIHQSGQRRLRLCTRQRNLFKSCFQLVSRTRQHPWRGSTVHGFAFSDIIPQAHRVLTSGFIGPSNNGSLPDRPFCYIVSTSFTSIAFVIILDSSSASFSSPANRELDRQDTIAVGVVVPVAVIASLMVVLIFRWRYRTRRQAKTDNNTTLPEETQPYLQQKPELGAEE